MPAISIKRNINAKIRQECEKRGLTPSEYIELLIDFYDLKLIEEMIKQFKYKRDNILFNAADKAALEILKIYLDVIT